MELNPSKFHLVILVFAKSYCNFCADIKHLCLECIGFIYLALPLFISITGLLASESNDSNQLMSMNLSEVTARPS